MADVQDSQQSIPQVPPVGADPVSPPSVAPLADPLSTTVSVPQETPSVVVAELPLISVQGNPEPEPSQDALPEATDPIEPVPAPEMPVDIQDVPVAPPTDPLAVQTDPTESEETPSAAGGDAPASDSERSPLDILEEILAGANAEQDLKNKEEEEKARKEAEEKAVFEAKKAQFAQETESKMAGVHTALQEAATLRENVDAQLGEPDSKNAGKLDDEFAINQLTHDTIQTTE